MENIEKYLDSIGKKSSTERLGVIASMNLGNRSEEILFKSKSKTQIRFRNNLKCAGRSFLRLCITDYGYEALPIKTFKTLKLKLK